MGLLYLYIAKLLYILLYIIYRLTVVFDLQLVYSV